MTTIMENNNSYVGGRFVAANYGQWVKFPSSVPRNIIGVHTFVVLSPRVMLPDGRSFLPFAVGTPIVFGSETLTPSVVEYDSQNTVCTLTCDFTMEHNDNQPISSATWGLQEALNDAAGFGGCVTVDGQWSELGGTDAMIADATVPGNTGIEDVRTGPASGGGGIGGSGTAGFIAQFSSVTDIEDSIIDYGVTTPGALTSNNPGAGGTIITDSGGGGIAIDDSGSFGPGLHLTSNGAVNIIGKGTGVLVAAGITAGAVTDGPVQVVAGAGIFIANDPETPGAGYNVTLENLDTGGIQILDSGPSGPGVSISTNGNIALTAVGTVDILNGLLQFGLLFSVAGTALPDPTTVPPGTVAMVTDATLPTLGGVYVGGGAVFCLVVSDGTNWYTT